MIKDLRKKLKSDKGFSLVELIIVIAIIAILVAVVGAFIIRYIEKSKIRTDVSNGDVILAAVTTAANEPEVFRYLSTVTGAHYEIPAGNRVWYAGGGLSTDLLTSTIDQNLGATKEFKYTKDHPTNWIVDAAVVDGVAEIRVEHLQISAIPGNLNRVTDGSFHS